MRHFMAAAFGLGLALGGAAFGQTATSEPAVVVELYTSQGCSSCPPADEFFATLAKQPQVIALALHVDYWDYIGWEDKFAQPQFTERQKSYARAAGSRMIYTPQMIVGGVDRVEGNKPEMVEALIARHLDVAHGVTLEVRREGGMLRIVAKAEPPLDRAVRVQLVRYRDAETVEIERGENAGRRATYHNIVTSWEALGDWNGVEPLTLEAKAEGADPAVVILQAQGPAEILAAARVD